MKDMAGRAPGKTDLINEQICIVMDANCFSICMIFETIAK